jgi:hypothetical protein
MAISTISPQSKIQGLPGTSTLSLSIKAIDSSDIAATYYINPGVYAMVSASTDTTSSIKIYLQETQEVLLQEAFSSNSAIFKYFSIPENKTGAVDIYFTTGAISVNIFGVKE